MIIRTPHRKRYTSIANQVLEDDRLSYRARGVMGAILAKPDRWRFDSDDLARHGKEGRDAIRTALRELRDFGYLVYEKVRDPETGRITTVTTVVECPQCSDPVPDLPTDGEPDPTGRETPGRTGDGLPGAGLPGAGLPAAGLPGPLVSNQAIPPTGVAAAPPSADRATLFEDVAEDEGNPPSYDPSAEGQRHWDGTRYVTITAEPPRTRHGALWEAVRTACRWERPTKTQKTWLGASAKELVEVGATVAEVEQFAVDWRREWPKIKISPGGIVKNWGHQWSPDRAGPDPPPEPLPDDWLERSQAAWVAAQAEAARVSRGF